jgi:hypothetical protein
LALKTNYLSLKIILTLELVLLDPLLVNETKNQWDSHIALRITEMDSSQEKVKTTQHWFKPKHAKLIIGM